MRTKRNSQAPEIAKIADEQNWVAGYFGFMVTMQLLLVILRGYDFFKKSRIFAVQVLCFQHGFLAKTQKVTASEPKRSEGEESHNRIQESSSIRRIHLTP
ncbi:MAG TPA: hypothetical protein VI636_11140 [Candidatus Angelobacter sp.]